MNNKGNALISVVMAASILSVITLGSLRVVNSNIKANKSMQATLEQQTLINNIKIILSDKQECTNNFSGILVNQIGPFERNKAFSVNNIRSSQNISINTTTNYGAGLGIEKIELERINSLPATGDAIAKLKVQFNKAKFSNDNSVIGSPYSKIHELLIRLKTSSGRVQECIMDNESLVGQIKKDTCENIGGVYDPATENCDTSALLRQLCSSMNGVWRNNKCDQSQMLSNMCSSLSGSMSGGKCTLPVSEASPSVKCPCGTCGAVKYVHKSCPKKHFGSDTQTCLSVGWVTVDYGECKCMGGSSC